MNPYTLGISKTDILFVLEILRVISFPIILCTRMWVLATARSLYISLDNLDVHDEINFGVQQVREIVSHGGQFSRFAVCAVEIFLHLFSKSPIRLEM